MHAQYYLILADVVVALHMAYVLFVVFGLLAVLLGYLRGWRWVRNKWFRLTHLGMIGIVVIEALLNITCPLTTLENWLRFQAGQSATAGSFIGRWVHDLLFYDASPEFFTVLYCGFGGAVLAALFVVPIDWRRKEIPGCAK